MDIQFWIWLIIIVASFLARALKKPAQQPKQPQANPEEYENPNKPISFEELLREIQSSKNPPRQVIEQKAPKRIEPKSYEIDYDDDIPEEEQDLETIPSRNFERSSEVYEKAKKDAFSRPSLEETMKLSDTKMEFSHFKGYQDLESKTIATEILKDFHDPAGFRKAFIMSEILKRKF